MTRRRVKPTFCVKPPRIITETKRQTLIFIRIDHKVENENARAVTISTKEVLVIEQSSTLARCGERCIGLNGIYYVYLLDVLFNHYRIGAEVVVAQWSVAVNATVVGSTTICEAEQTKKRIGIVTTVELCL